MPRHPPCALTTNTPPIQWCATRKTHTKQHKKQEIKQKNDFASTIQFSHNTTPPPATIMITSRQGRKIPHVYCVGHPTATPSTTPPLDTHHIFSLERRRSSRTFRYGYLVTTSSQSPIPPSTTPPTTKAVVRPWASGVTNFHDVTGGVYKARERIHRSVADLRLLATPTSWGRVADPNPN